MRDYRNWVWLRQQKIPFSQITLPLGHIVNPPISLKLLLFYFSLFPLLMWMVEIKQVKWTYHTPITYQALDSSFNLLFTCSMGSQRARRNSAKVFLICSCIHFYLSVLGEGDGIDSNTKRTLQPSQFFSLGRENSQIFQCSAISVSNVSGLLVKEGTGKQKETSSQKIWRKYSLKGQDHAFWTGGKQLIWNGYFLDWWFKSHLNED